MRQFVLFFICIVLYLFASSCQEKIPSDEVGMKQALYRDVRLGDGVALQLSISLQWHRLPLESGRSRPDSTLDQLMNLRSAEIVREVSNRFTSVDSVYRSQRQTYITAIKDALLESLSEPEREIHEVIVYNIEFPTTFTSAMEAISLQQLKEERIGKENELAIAQAAADKKKAVAEGDVAIARAEADGRLQAIQARTESNRRKSEMAKAETAAAVARTQASAEADRLRKIKAVEVEKQREIELIAVEKQREMDKVALEQQLELARLCEQNPTYASFLVNRELAGNVEIAVLPTGTDTNVFGGLLQSRLPGKKNND